jgi:chromosome segregation ATPase
MEIEQLAKRLEWLDEERRKDKTSIATLEEKLSRLEGGIDAVKKEIKSFQSELGQINSIYGRLDQIDNTITQVRMEIGRVVDTIQKTAKESEYGQEAKRRQEIEDINRAILEVRKPLDQIPELKKSIKDLQDEQKNIAELIPPMDQKVMSAQVGFEEFQRSFKMIEDARKVDAKRLTDLQGEISAYRKRIDEQRARIDVLIENVKKNDTRLVELNSSEVERRQSQVAFVEKQSQMGVELERKWREMEAKFSSVVQAASSVDEQLSSLEETARSIRKTKDQLDEATQRINRRVNEITEMHRLNEDHFRQEWTAYKADDHKRWANYNLIQEEHQKDMVKQTEKLELRLVQLEDVSQQVSDHFDELNEETQKRLRSLLDVAHSWVSSYERTFGKLTEED